MVRPRMRTRAEAQRSPTRDAVASRRGRTAGKAKPAVSSAQPPSPPEAPGVAVTNVRMLRVDEGLYALRIGPIAGALGKIAGMALPVAQISAPFAEDGNGVEIIAAYPRKGPWVDKEGGTVILRSPTGGGVVVVTVYGGAEQQTGELALDLQRLDGLGNGGAGVARPAAADRKSVG